MYYNLLNGAHFFNQIADKENTSVLMSVLDALTDDARKKKLSKYGKTF